MKSIRNILELEDCHLCFCPHRSVHAGQTFLRSLAMRSPSQRRMVVDSKQIGTVTRVHTLKPHEISSTSTKFMPKMLQVKESGTYMAASRANLWLPLLNSIPRCASKNVARLVIMPASLSHLDKSSSLESFRYSRSRIRDGRTVETHGVEWGTRDPLWHWR